MKKFVWFGWLLSALIQVGFSQQELSNFQNQITPYYHTIAGPEVQNFTFKITTAGYINFIKPHADSTFYYPLKVIWFNNGKTYYEIQPFPTLSDSLRKQLLRNAQALKNLWSFVLPEFVKFLVHPPLHDMPEDASISFGKDTVGVTIRFAEDTQKIFYSETFTRGGQLGRTLWQSGAEKVIKYPMFDEVNGKWLCMGWDIQVYQNENVQSGVRVWVVHGRQNERILPEQLNLVIQRRDENGKALQNNYVLFVKDFAFNQDIQIVSSTPDSTAGPQ